VKVLVGTGTITASRIFSSEISKKPKRREPPMEELQWRWERERVEFWPGLALLSSLCLPSCCCLVLPQAQRETGICSGQKLSQGEPEVNVQLSANDRLLSQTGPFCRGNFTSYPKS
jgi:hypothetical protein